MTDLGYPPDPTPLRGELPREVQIAARLISRDVWGERYRPLKGPMHYAGGPYWRNELLRRAGVWEQMAAAARCCADALPAGEPCHWCKGRGVYARENIETGARAQAVCPRCKGTGDEPVEGSRLEGC